VPVDEIKPGVRKTSAAQFRPQLYHTKDDPAETKDVSAEHPEVVRELTALLNRYRDGGYSRELPPEGVKAPRKNVAELAPLVGATILHEPLSQMPGKPWAATRGEWVARDGGVWGAQKGGDDRSATLRVPFALTDGSIDFEINFRGANRTSLRVEWGERQGSFRIELSRTAVGITKNPSPG
jgi:hypothetical protein